MKKVILGLCGLGIIGAIGCDKGSKVNSALPPPVAAPAAIQETSSPTPSPTPVASVTPSPETLNLQKENKDLADKNKELSADLNNKQNQIGVLAATQKPIEVLLNSIAPNKPAPLLLAFYGANMGQIRAVEAEMSSLSSMPVARYVTTAKDQASSLGLFFVSLDSVEKFKSFQDRVALAAPNLRMVLLPPEQFFVRSHLQLSYKKATIFGSQTFTKTFVIGDSPLVSHISEVAPYLKDCDHISQKCFKTLVDHGYFKNAQWIDGGMQNPLKYLATEFGKSAWMLNNQGYRGRLDPMNLKNSTQPVIDNIRIIHALWIGSSDQVYLDDLARFSDAYNSSVAEITSSNYKLGFYETPSSSSTELAPITGTHDVDLGVIMSQLQGYICSVVSCLPGH